MKKLIILQILLLFYIVTSCSSDSDDDMNNANVTYNGTIKNIIDSNCLGCHIDPPVNGAPMSLTSYQDVKESVMNTGLIGRVENGTMPINGSLSASQVQAIKDWQTAGFLE